MRGICAGSGQKPYDSTQGWINIDVNPKWNPDIVADWRDLSMIEADSIDIVVAEQSVEHVGCGEADPFFTEANRILKSGGSLIITVPDMRALAIRWLTCQIDDDIFSINIFGAYMGHESDRHKWNTSYSGWIRSLQSAAKWSRIGHFDWRPILGAPISRDWWILGMEAVK